MSDLTHVNEQGEARMVDVGAKAVTQRSATARSYIEMQIETMERIKENNLKKGDVLAVARIAGIQASKRCAELIPMCHQLNLTHASVDFSFQPEAGRLMVEATCKLADRTGVEMEALTAVSVAALTVYDMCKAIDKNMSIGPTRLVAKTGGKSGDFVFEDD